LGRKTPTHAAKDGPLEWGTRVVLPPKSSGRMAFGSSPTFAKIRQM